MTKVSGRKFSRRDFIRLGAITAAAGPSFAFPDRALASQKKLTIAKWAHFLPEYDPWFEGIAREWGEQHNTKVTVDHIPVERIHGRAAAEAEAGHGHDIFMFPWPPAEYYRHVIDHAEIYQTVAQRYGQIDRLAHRSTFDRKTKKYFAFADSWIPAPLHYFEDYWSELNMPMGPVHWNGLRTGAKRIREKLGVPSGLALTPTLEGNVTLYTLLTAFSSSVLDMAGKVTLNNARTVVALRYVSDLHKDAGAEEQLAWGPGGNVRAMLARKASSSMNAISLLRAAEKEDPEVARKLRIQPPLFGSSGVVAVPHVTNCSVVWNFSRNQEGAKQFLAHLIDQSKAAYERSQGCNLPFYQKTVPDLIVRLRNDPKADPVNKYQELKDALYWTHNLGVPGYATPAVMEVFNAFVIPRMFLSVVKGERSPVEAASAAAAEAQRIADKWKQGPAS
jgi:multiple sugar transport system substrate-binding protein